MAPKKPKGVKPEEAQAPEEQDPKLKKKRPAKKTGGFPGAAPEPEQAEPADGEPYEMPEEPAAEGTGIAKEGEDARPQAEVDAENELNAEIDANFRLAMDAEADWIEAAKEDIEFKAGKQWSDEDKAVLDGQKRPCLTFNKIKAIIKLITGHFVQNSARIQVAPQGGEDQRFSDVADRILQHIDEQAKLEFNLGFLFSGGQTTGRGYIELHVDYERDPIFGELKSIYHAKPGIVLFDPRGTDYDLNADREFGFKLVRKSKGELKDLYPDKAELIDEISQDEENPFLMEGKEGDANNYGNDKSSITVGLNKKSQAEDNDKPGSGLYWCKEYYRYKRKTKHFVYFVHDGSKDEYDSKELADAAIKEKRAMYIEGGGFPGQFEAIYRVRRLKEMHVAVRCGGKILADGLSPTMPSYTGYPLFQFIADWTPEAEDKVQEIQGLVRCLKDPQREKNKARSQFLHIINTAANSGWVSDEDALSDAGFEELKTFGAVPGHIVRKKAGSTLERLTPVPAPMAQQVREKAASDDFKEVSGVNSDLLSIDESANPSGKAIQLRIRQAITILETDFRNFRLTKKLIGTAIVQMIPSLFDVARIKMILGENFMMTNKVDDAFIKAFLMQIEDLKYNVSIAEQGDTKTNREETLDVLMKLVEKGMQIPFEVLAEFMTTIPNKQEVINKITAYQQQQAIQAQQLAAAKGAAPGGAQPPVGA